MFKKFRLVSLTTVLIMALFLSACGGGGAGENAGGGETGGGNGENGVQLGQKEITLAYVAWASAIASNHVMKVVLENLGYDVTLKQVQAGSMFAGVASGSADATLAVWLPHTHASYWEEYGDSLVDLGVSIEGAPLGLVVPKYMKDINSITDLKGNSELGKATNWTITGIDPGAGLMQLTEKALKVYQLDKWNLRASSGPAMTSALKKAVADKEKIVVTLWSPHWAFSAWDLKYLKDPKNVYGDPDDLHTVVREGLKEDAPAAYKVLDQFNWTKDDMGKVMINIHKGMEPLEAAKKWVENNQDLVNEWTKGIGQS